MSLTDDDLSEIEARCNAATPGPWEVRNPGCWPGEIGPTGVSGGSVATASCHDNAEFIAHAREDVPALVAEVRALREIVRPLAEALKHWLKDNNPTASFAAGEAAAAMHAYAKRCERLYSEIQSQIDDGAQELSESIARGARKMDANSQIFLEERI